MCDTANNSRKQQRYKKSTCHVVSINPVWSRSRKIAAGVPEEHLKFRTRFELALIMLKEQRELLPHGWITGDDEFGRSSLFRKALNDMLVYRSWDTR